MKNTTIILVLITAILSCKKEQIIPLPELGCELIFDQNEAKFNILGTWKLEESWMKDNSEFEQISKSYKFVDSINLIITNEFELNNPIESNWLYSINYRPNEPDLLQISIEGLTPALGGILKICENKMGIESDKHWEIFVKD